MAQGGAPRQGVEASLVEAVGAAPFGCALLDPELRFVWVNAAFAAIHGASPAEHVGRTLDELWPDGRAAPTQARMREVLRSGQAELHLDVPTADLGPGLDPSMRDQLHRWSDAMMAGDGRSDDDPALLAAATAFGEYAAMCSELIEARRGQPVTEDLISILTHAYDEGALARQDLDDDPAPPSDGDGGGGGVAPGAAGDATELTDDELFMFLCLLVVAGNETTRNALTGGLLALSRFPEERDKLIGHPELYDTAVEEIVRYVSPVISFTRTITETHDYEGHRFEEGQRVLLLYQSANRDEAVFDDADAFKVDRSPNPHLGFGIGTHYCLGANLARAEIKVVFQELFARLADIRVPEGATPVRGDNTLVIALQHLPAVFTPERASA